MKTKILTDEQKYILNEIVNKILYEDIHQTQFDVLANKIVYTELQKIDSQQVNLDLHKYETYWRFAIASTIQEIIDTGEIDVFDV